MTHTISVVKEHINYGQQLAAPTEPATAQKVVDRVS